MKNNDHCYSVKVKIEQETDHDNVFVCPETSAQRSLNIKSDDAPFVQNSASMFQRVYIFKCPHVDVLPRQRVVTSLCRCVKVA